MGPGRQHIDEGTNASKKRAQGLWYKMAPGAQKKLSAMRSSKPKGGLKKKAKRHSSAEAAGVGRYSVGGGG